MGESRQELLGWLNDLLQLNVTKVEQCGSGAALCQIFDSIYLDVPMSKVKFNINSEYAYIQNFKVLQNCFTKHKVDRIIPIESLVKCKMQDNLEFLQWTKRYWDQHFPGVEYDPVARRKAAGTSAPAGPGMRGSTNTGPAPRRPIAGANAGAVRVPRTGSSASGGGGAASAALIQENSTLKEAVTGLERERDFYFQKLRDIELLVQAECEQKPELEQDENGLVPRIQTILYSTEEGFEIPTEDGGAVEGGVVGEEETF